MTSTEQDPRSEYDDTERAGWLESVQTWDQHMAEARRGMENAVAQARIVGCSWAEIGDTLGISRQAAQQRFGSK